MAPDWESQFKTWAQPPSESETDRIDNAIRAIRKALDADQEIGALSRVFPQGSYRNRVNVRQDSDVDLGVLYTGNSFYGDYPEGTSADTFGIGVGDMSYATFKNHVERALVSYFGRTAVNRGNKAFDVHANSYRLDADVVPLFVHRRYAADGTYICGVQLFADNGGKAINWPERLYDTADWPNQHYENGVAKNQRTQRAYKGAVRILKTLRNRLAEGGSPSATAVSGFEVECLVWNAPDACFHHATWDRVMQSILAHLWLATETDEGCEDWGEVSEWKYLFKGSPAAKRANAFAFVDEAWSHIGVRE